MTSLSEARVASRGPVGVVGMPTRRSGEPVRHRPGRLLLAVPALGALAVLAYGAAIALSGPLLGRDASAVPAKADFMVVLGGDGPARADYALTLWHQRLAAKVLVTGYGDCASIRDRLVAGGVPPTAVAMECRARSTWENAQFSVPMLASHGAQSVLLVTSWFHARRALASFEAMCPGMRFSVASVPAPAFAMIATGPYGTAIVQEYVKTAWYAGGLWLHGVMGGLRPRTAARQASGVSQWTRC